MSEETQTKEKVIERRTLKYEFSAIETHELSLQLASKTKEKVALEEEKKSVASSYKARIDEVTATCNKLSNQVSDGFEMRDIECEGLHHQPEVGKKSIIRTDNNQLVIVEKMTDYEWNLFNQPEDEEAHNEDDLFPDDGYPEEKPKAKRGRKK